MGHPYEQLPERDVEPSAGHVDAPEQGLAEVWSRHSAEIFRRCVALMGGNRAEAEEAFSRVAMKVLHKLSEQGLQARDRRAWLLRLAHNVCMDLHRENKRRPEQEIAVAGAAGELPATAHLPARGDPESGFLEKEMQEVLRRAINGLAWRLRQVVLRKLAGDSNQQIAERLGITEVNLRKRLQQARSALRLALISYRDGGEQEPARPRFDARAGGETAPPYRIHALRPLHLQLASGVETDATLEIVFAPRKASARREQALAAYCAHHPGGWKKRLEMAHHLMQAGRLEEAIPHLEQVAAKQTGRWQSWFELWSIHRLLETPGAAAAVCERALAGARAAAELAFWRGLLARSLGHHREAQRALEAACETAPGCPLLWTSLAAARLDAGRPAEAVGALDAALRLDGTDVAALSSGQDALRWMGRSGVARRRIELALDRDSGNAAALARWYALRCRAAGGRFSPGAGERQRQRALRRLAEDRAEACAAAAYGVAVRGDLAGAAAMLARLVRRDPRLRQAWHQYALLLDRLGRVDEALAALDQARALRPAGGDAHWDLDVASCRLAVRAGRWDLALAQAAVLSERWSYAWEAAAAAAWALASAGGEAGRAISVSCAAVDLQPHLPAAWIEHGHVLARCARHAEAVEVLETAWRLLPADDGFDLAAPAALVLAALHRRRCDAASARLWAGRALAAAEAEAGVDPVTAGIRLARARRELADARLHGGATPDRPAVPAGGAGAAWRTLQARWLRASQLSEPLWP